MSEKSENETINAIERDLRNAMRENETINTIEGGFFRKLSNGDFGLAKTYWLYNVLAIIVGNILMELSAYVLMAIIAYSIPSLTGLWKAANKYRGSRIWSVLAKIITIIGIITIIAIILLIFSPLFILFGLFEFTP